MEGFFQFSFKKICPFKFINIFSFLSLSVFPQKQQQIIMIDFTITKLSTHTHTRSHGLTLFRTTIRIEKLNSSKKRSRKKIFSAARTHIHKHARTGIEKQCVQRNEYYLKVQHTSTFCFVSSFYLQLFSLTLALAHSLRVDICAAFCVFLHIIFFHSFDFTTSECA